MLTAQRPTEGYKTTSCGNQTSITYGNGAIIMQGKKDKNYSFQVLDSRKKVIFECNESCGNNQEIDQLAAGRYRIIIKNEKGKKICNKQIKLSRPICTARSGRLTPLERRVTLNNEAATLEAIINDAPFIPVGFSKIYLLTSGENMNIIAMDTLPVFTVNEKGNYQIHTLIIEEASINLTELLQKKMSIFYLNLFLKGNKNNFCSALDLKGARFRVRLPDNNVYTGSGSGVGSSRIMCNNISFFKEGKILTISSDDDERYYFKINDIENHLSKVYACREDCDTEEMVLELPNSKYLLSVYNKRGKKICKEKFEIAVPDNDQEVSAAGRSHTHLSLAAYRAKRTVALEWLTNTGYKVNHFELEHSTNGVDFIKIDQFNNEDWSNEMAYHQTTDEAPHLGINYYRVKQVFVDDSFKYSPVQQVDFSIDLEKTAVYPNPAQEAIFVNLKQYIGSKGQLMLTNQFGQQVQQIDLATIEQEKVMLNISNVKNGVYYLNIQVDGYRVLTERVLVQRFY